MPLGVEHILTGEDLEREKAIPKPLMPLGVEHTATHATLPLTSHSQTFDAVRR